MRTVHCSKNASEVQFPDFKFFSGAMKKWPAALACSAELRLSWVSAKVEFGLPRPPMLLH